MRSLNQILAATSAEAAAETRKAHRIPLKDATADIAIVPTNAPVQVTSLAVVATNDCRPEGASRWRSVTNAVTNIWLTMKRAKNAAVARATESGTSAAIAVTTHKAIAANATV